jgi:hypothetical protein
MVSLFADCYLSLLKGLLDFFRFLNASASFDQFISDEKALKAYREILLSSFAHVPDAHSAELYQLFSSYRPIVFHATVFADNHFTYFWFHLTRQRGGEAPERIRCMEFVMKLISSTTLAAYSNAPIQADWIQFKTEGLKPHFDAADFESRVTRMLQIIDGKQKKYVAAAKHELLSRICRVCNVEAERHLSTFSLNLQMRRLERRFYEFSLLSKKVEYQNSVPSTSFHLSPVALPVYQSRALSPSPFPLRTPPFRSKTRKNWFALPFVAKSPRIRKVADRAILCCCPEWWSDHSDAGNYSSPFEYSYIIDQGHSALLALFSETFSDFVVFHHVFPISFFYFIHIILSVLFVSDRFLMVLILAKCDSAAHELTLLSELQNPVAFLPFTESVALGEFAQTYLFCGHVVIAMKAEKIMIARRHLYIHQPIGLSFCPFGSSPVILIFTTVQDVSTVEKLLTQKSPQVYSKILPPTRFYITINSVQKASNLWYNNMISNFDYLLLLNFFSGRSFADLSQYPIVPWACSPQLEPRDLSKPMGQLSANRAAHFEQTYELSSPKYYYGFHYSLPGAVFWFLMRLPPFTFFQWDLNEGWDDSQRLFTSIVDAFQSASWTNPSDLKELIPQLYTTPESLENVSGLDLAEGVTPKVGLPSWANENSYFYMEMSLKTLNQSQDLNAWIDLVFGFKEIGDAAVVLPHLHARGC